MRLLMSADQHGKWPVFNWLLTAARDRGQHAMNLAVFNVVSLDHEGGILTWPNGAAFDPATLHEWPRVSGELAARARAWAEPPDEPQANTALEPSARS
jgi:hypothetical protein